MNIITIIFLFYGELNEHLLWPLQVLDLSNGTYEIGFSAPTEGTYSLEVQLYGQAVNGSPFTIAATPPLEEDSGSSHRSIPTHNLTRQTSHSTQVIKLLNKLLTTHKPIRQTSHS